MSLCPNCNEPMIIFELEGVEIDRCVACEGTWLDAGEIERIAEREGAQAGPLTQALAAAKVGRRGERRCPRCRAKLRKATVPSGADAGIEIDRCPRGHGLWFDRGEMETLVRSVETGEAGGVARFFSDLYGHMLSGQRKEG